MKKDYLFTSESVSEGHPDKVCDRISDMVVDSYLGAEPQSRVACETLTTTNKVVLAGEVRGPEIKRDDLIQKVRDCIKDIGYDQKGFTWRDATKIESHLHSQSADIAMGVDSAGNKDEGAGDQGIMFGFACDETPELMPLPISLAHRLARQLAIVRHQNILDYLLPDGKTQVSVSYEDGIPTAIDTILISTQHKSEIDGITREGDIQRKITKDLWKYVVEPATEDLPLKPSKGSTRFLVNPTGKFVIGGPQGDAGLTGRKIIVDTYGGYARHGGGAFSGKDPTKVDRSAAYAARFVAKALVAANLAKKVEVQLSYAIGLAKPISILVDSFGTGKISDAELTQLVQDQFDLRPGAIIKSFNLQNLPSTRGGRFYRDTAAYGHFGRNDLSLPWVEVSKKANELKALF